MSTVNEKAKIYYQANKVSILAKLAAKRRLAGMPERKPQPLDKRQYAAAYYQKHREKILAGFREQKAERLAYYHRNKSRIRKAAKIRYLRDRERIKAASMTWQKAHPDHKKAYKAKRRQLVKSTSVEIIKMADVIAKSRGQCGICGKRVALKDRSLDHIVPLSKGGTHTYANVQLAHFSCNSSKWANFGHGVQPGLELGE